MLSQMVGAGRMRARSPALKESGNAVRVWLSLVTLVLVPLNLYSVFGYGLESALIGIDSSWVRLTVTAGMIIVIFGILACWWVFYRHWWRSVSGNLSTRWFWPLVLLSVPYGLLLYYFFAYSGRKRHEKWRRNSGCSVIT